MEKIKLWEEFPAKIPENKQEPYLEYFPIPTGPLQFGATVILVPGGGYGGVCKEHEGRQIALWLNSIGYSVFMLTYRVAPYRAPVPYMDLSRAVRYVRFHAAEYHIDPNKIGAMGFSAGGHLVASVAVRSDSGIAGDPIDAVSNQLDFAALIYPVISTDPTHLNTGTFPNLLGDRKDDPAALAEWALERHTHPDMPPVFMIHALDDTCVGVENSLAFAASCRKQNVPLELHIYPNGGHGFGICRNNEHTTEWKTNCEHWLNAVTERFGRGLR